MSFFRSPWPIVIVVVAAILLFGANKLPGLARNMGKSMRIFKSEVEELRGDDKDVDDEDDDRPVRSSRTRDDRDDVRPRRDDRDERPVRDDRPVRDEREYDPRVVDERDPAPVRGREDDEPYRRD